VDGRVDVGSVVVGDGEGEFGDELQADKNAAARMTAR
jgi:hypothetical protein